jgi:protein disulfide isomerase family A protein 3
VIVLTESNFDSIVNAAPLILVEFYAPWCGHCKHLAPEYAKAATQLLKEEPPIKLAKVDATVESSLGTRFDVSGYPTLKVFRNGVAAEYSGPRDAAGIVKYMRGQNGPSAKPIATDAELAKFTAHEFEPAFVAFVAAGSDAEKAFKAVADKNREDFRFAVVTDAALAASRGASVPSVVAFRPKTFETVQEKLAGAPTEAAIAEFLYAASLPLAGVYDSGNAKIYAKAGLPRVTVWTSVDKQKAPKQITYYLNRIKKVAAGYKGKANFVLEDKSAREFGELGFGQVEAAIGAVDATGGKYKSDAAFSVEALDAFAKQFIAGSIAKHVKSEPIPTEHDGDVTVVVGKTFDEQVLDKSKDVFVEFYAPWCGHCKSLAPKWSELATKLKEYPSLRIAKIDATANDIPSNIEVRGYPTILLFKNDGSAPVPYDGAREVKDMQAWLKKTVSRPLKAAHGEL